MSGGVNKLSVREANNLSMGQDGFLNITTGVNATSPSGFIYIALICDADSTYSAVSAVGTPNSDDLVSQARPQESIRVGRFSSCTVTSGRVIGILAPEED